MAQRPLCGSPWMLKYPYCHPMITQTHPGVTEGFQKRSNFEKFAGATKQPIERENGPILIGKGPFWGGGGATKGTRSLDPRPPPWVRGVHRARVQFHTKRPQYAKKSPPRNNKMGYPGGQNSKIHWGIIFCPKLMILQGVGRRIQYLGVCNTDDPKKWGANVRACA